MNSDNAFFQQQGNIEVAYRSSDAHLYSCRWADCGAQLENAEALFVHVNEDHVGRNSRGNLCLECRWDGCPVSKSKRDHLISHVKSHLSYKPYQCDRCSGRFKHMSDLKRHVGTHRNKDNSPISAYKSVSGGTSIGPMSPGISTHKVGTKFTQAIMNPLTEATFAPVYVGAAQTGGVSPPIYADGLPPSPIPTPSMNSYERECALPIEMIDYAATGFLAADGAAFNVIAMEVDPLAGRHHVNNTVADSALAAETIPNLSQTPSTTHESLTPQFTQDFYVNLLSVALTTQSQQAGLTSDAPTSPQFSDFSSAYPSSPPFSPIPSTGAVSLPAAPPTIPFNTSSSPVSLAWSNLTSYRPKDVSGKRHAYATSFSRYRSGPSSSGGVERRRRRPSPQRSSPANSGRAAGFLL